MGYSSENTLGGIPLAESKFRLNKESAIDNTDTKDLTSSIELWKNASAKVIGYPGGRITDRDGNTYRYGDGKRLLIEADNTTMQVMDTCEAPWAVETVDQAFATKTIKGMNPKHKLRVLERGAGLNIAGTKVIDHLMQRGSGEYHVIELNQDVLQNEEFGVYAWKDIMMRSIKDKSERSGIKYDIDIVIHEGDAREVTQRLENEKKKFNIIISDTFPLEKTETGVNDIEDIATLTKILYSKEGVFTFFAYYPGMEDISGSHLSAEQLALLRPHFSNIAVSEAPVKPARGYDYLFNNGFPIKNLPVVICEGKK
ncbi:MAG: hypothetical protein KBC00_01740 [Candidatus Levybacteria bacterium]|nr:hypothetical protein [Candidatus Levybacteria bacterium]MBP9815044.1 hypothetical protein [Candidatus Levybacteria bacterium]